MELKYLKVNNDDTMLYATLCYIHKNGANIKNKKELAVTKNVLTDLIFEELYIEEEGYIAENLEKYPLLSEDCKSIISACTENSLKHKVFLKAVENFIEGAKIRSSGFEIVNKAISSLEEANTNNEQAEAQAEAAAGTEG